jgi:ureidoglycolate hydrolase
MRRPPTITAAAFARFGTVHAPIAGTRDHAAEGWVKLASDSYASPIESRRFQLEAAGPVTIIEVHPGSPQLTVSFDADWTIRVLPKGQGPDGATPQLFNSFTVPAGTGVILNAGLWHTPVLAQAATEALVAFRDGTTDHGTDWVELTEPLAFED